MNKRIVAAAIGALVAVLGLGAVAFVDTRQKPPIATTENVILPPAVAEERALIAAELRAQPRLEFELRSKERRRTFKTSDGTRMTVFSTPDAVVIQYGSHEYATVSYP